MSVSHSSTAPRRLPPWRRLTWRLAAGFALLTVLGILLSGLLQYRAEDSSLRRTRGEYLLSIARTGALLLDPGLVLEVHVSRNPDSEAYRWLRSTLSQLQAANGLESPVAILGDYEPGRGLAHVIVRGGGPEVVGEPYPVVPEVFDAFERAFRDGAASRTDVYRNPSGTWITAFAPIVDASGQAVAMLATDTRVDVYLAELAAVRSRLLLHSAAGALVALVAGVVLARRISQPVLQLTGLARDVVEGDLTTRVPIRSRDEVGLLGNVLNLMTERLQITHHSIVDVLVRALEARGDDEGGSRRVANAALAIADRLDLTPAQREALELGALLHDLGEIRTPEAVLRRSGALDPRQRRLVDQHPLAGVDMLEDVPLLTPAIDVVGAHHERWDGGGHPRGLSADAIPLAARIFAVADTLDAVTHDRPHRKARPLEQALEIVAAEAGKQFDPRVAEVALAIPVDRWREILLSAA